MKLALMRIALLFAATLLTGRAFASTPAGAGLAAITETAMTASWTLDAPATESPLVVLDDDADFSSPHSSVTLAVGSNSQAFASLTPNKRYYFKVKVSTEPDSAYSAPVSAYTLPAQPAAPAFSWVRLSSAAFTWGTAGNRPGTEYYAELGADPAYGISFASVTVLSTASFQGLLPNTTYFARVLALGDEGSNSSFSDGGSSATLAAAPLSPSYSLVTSTRAALLWGSGGNPDGTAYRVDVSTDDFATLNYSTGVFETSYEASGLQPNTTHYFRVSAYGWGGVYSSYSVLTGSCTRAEAPQPNPTPFTGLGASGVTAWWLGGGNPAGTEYYLGVSTSPDFLGPEAWSGGWTSALTRLVTPLDGGTTYYFRVKARNLSGDPTAWTQLGSTKTLPGSDISPPSVIDLQSGDDAWRGASGGFYKVYFADTGSGLSRFQVKVSSGPNFSGTVVADWTNVVSGISAQEYNSDWQLPAGVFSAIPHATTGYVSVRVYDNSSNVTVSTDVFYVRRDTVPPAVTDNAASPAGWLAADPGAIFDVDFADALSGLSAIEYSASNLPGAADAAVLPWTSIWPMTSSPTFTALWGVNFNALPDGVTSYISARARDAAGNYTTASDVFRILKNTNGPVVALVSPSSLFVSTASALAGTAAPRTESSDLAAVEAAIQARPTGLWWDGSAFSALSQVWLKPSGLSSWSLPVSTYPLVDGSSYTAVARARDSLGRYSNPYSTFTFTIDRSVPAVAVSSPAADAVVYSFDAMTGSASDPAGAGLSSIEVAFQRVSDGRWWNFSGGYWGETPVSSGAPAAASWSFAPDARLKGAFMAGTSYYVTCQAADAAVPPNLSVFGAVGSTFTFVDDTPPLAPYSLWATTGSLPGRVDLSWINGGDENGAMIAAGMFAIGYSTEPGAAFSTAAAQVLFSTVSVLPGSTHYYTVSGLGVSATYYFKVWAADDAGFWSAASNLSGSISGESLQDSISGKVRTAGGAGISGAIVEAIATSGALAATAYTQDDGSGTFTLSNLADGAYRVQVSWIYNDIISAVSKDDIPMGFADTDFELSSDYLLASVSGVIPAAAPSGLRPRSASGRAELLQRGRRLLTAYPDAEGRFAFSGLMPGKYTLRVSDGSSFKDVRLELRPGETFFVKPFGQVIRSGSVYAYPNPARTQVRFRVETDMAPVEKRLSVFGVDGRLAYTAGDSGPWSAAGPAWELPLDLSGFAPGVYVYSVKLRSAATGETSSVVRKFAVIR